MKYVGVWCQTRFQGKIGVCCCNEQMLADDANADGTVNYADFLVLAANFGRTDMTARAGDFDDDGLIHFDDFLGLANNHSVDRSWLIGIP